MKKLISIIVALCVFIIPINTFAGVENTTKDVVQEIIENDKISKETKEWLLWFNNLSAQEQQYINYRPLELEGYNYEKTYFDDNDFSDKYLEINDVLLKGINNEITPTYLVPNDFGNKILPIGGYELKYNPTYWNKNRKRANCYTYALNYLAGTHNATQQPGYKSGQRFLSMTKTGIISAVKRDIKYISNVKGFREAGEEEVHWLQEKMLQANI